MGMTKDVFDEYGNYKFSDYSNSQYTNNVSATGGAMIGMTIEDCISKLIEILEEATEDENSVCYVTDVDEPTLKTAIDTMRKYQKIEKVLERIWNIPSHLINKEECLDRIMETYREVR